MSAAETGIYITLIATMYERGEPIKEDHSRLARLCGASNSSFKACLNSLVLDGKIIRSKDGLWNERVQKETVYRQEKSEVGRNAANALWDKKRNKINVGADANAMPGQSGRNANQKPESEPEARIDKEGSSLRSLAPQAASKRKLGTRLPNEWVLPQGWGRWALEEVTGATVEVIRSQADQFKDYWISKTGSGATKMDWEATWRNWIRTAVSRLPSANAANGFQKPARGVSALAERIRKDIEDGAGQDGSGSSDGEAVQRIPFFADERHRG